MKPLAGLARAFAALQGRLYNAPAQTIAGVKPENFPTANQPVAPVGPKGSQPLAWSFWAGINQNITPRPDAALTFQDLRELSTYPLARLLIETAKDSAASVKWAVQLRAMPGESLRDRRERQKNDPTIGKLTDFIAAPDGETEWPDWIRPILEDLITIDAAAFLLRRSLSGKVLQWRWTDGADILRLIDDQGYTPLPPSPAYTQLWEGVPRLFLDTNQLVYRPLNIVPRGTTASLLYGYGPVEQLAEEIKIGKARLNYVLSFYTEGAVPGLVQMVPPGVAPDKILEAMQWMNSELSGNLAARRQWRMVQSFSGDSQSTGPKDQIHQLKEPVLADVYDDLHIRKMCFGFGVSAQRLQRMMTRATAEANQEAAEEEGAQRNISWLRGAINSALRRMGFGRYEVVTQAEAELDSDKQSQIDDRNLRNGSQTIDAVRIARGEEPFGLPETAKPNIYLPTGIVPVEGSIDRVQEAHAAAIKPHPGAAQPNPGDDPAAPKLLADGNAKKKVAARPKIDPQRKTPRLAIAEAKAYTHVGQWLHAAGKAAVVAFSATTAKLAKADDDPEEIEDIVDAVLNEMDWQSLVELIEPDLSAAAVEGGDIGIEDFEITEQAVISAVNEAARDYAHDRAAELVGMKWVDGELVPNPNAAMRIDESTRNMVRQTISDAFTAETPVGNLAAELQSSHAFSEKRARLIAENEVRQAQIRGNLEAWKASGVVETFNWLLSGDHEVCDICDSYAEGSPYPLKDAERLLGHSHPLCQCILVAAKIKGIKVA